jgi:hypothetical protein
MWNSGCFTAGVYWAQVETILAQMPNTPYVESFIPSCDSFGREARTWTNLHDITVRRGSTNILTNELPRRTHLQTNSSGKLGLIAYQRIGYSAITDSFRWSLRNYLCAAMLIFSFSDLRIHVRS